MIPQDFDSFVYGFDLTAANYSGGAGGSFSPINSSAQSWAVNSATPVFSTQSGLEGMDFNGLASEAIKGPYSALWEATVVAICKPSSAASHYVYGGDNVNSNTYACLMNAYRASAFTPSASSGFTASSSLTSSPHVFAFSFSPENGKTYAQIDNGSVASNSPASGVYDNAALKWPTAAIGQHRNSYFTGWIGRVLVFNRALHYRDNANLQLLIADEMALVGL